MPLLLVLWGIMLISLITVSLSGTSLTSERIAHNTLRTAQVDAAAEAALTRAIVGLTDPRADKRWTNGRPESFSFHGFQATINIGDELGRIDLNSADRTLLFGLFRSVGVEAQSANRFVDDILEWRTPAGLAADILGQRKSSDDWQGSFRPRHGAFQSVDELSLMPWMTPELFHLVAPALTVYSRGQTIDPQLAPREALLAIPGITPERVSEILSAQVNRQTDRSAPSLGGRAFTVKIDLAGLGDTSTRYEAVVRLTDDPERPYWLLYWKRVPSDG